MSFYAMEVATTLNYTYMADTVTLAAVLAAIQILAMANHPTLPHLLYILYGRGTDVGYGSYILQTWGVQSTGRTLLANVTLAVSPACSPTCQMQISTSLMSIESSSVALVFGLQAITKQMSSSSPLKTYSKVNEFYGELDIYKLVAVSQNYAILYNTSALEVTTFDLATSTSTTSSYLISIFGKPIRIQISNNWVYFACNLTSLNISYACAPCIFRGDYAHGTQLPCTAIATSYPATRYLQLAMGEATDGQTVWIDADNSIYRFLVMINGWIEMGTLSGNNYLLYASNYQVVMFNEGSYYSMHSYHSLTNAADTQIAVFFIINSAHELASINSDSNLFSVYDYYLGNLSGNTQAVTQYQIVSSCSNYHASTGDTLCFCNTYENLYCKAISSSSSSSSSMIIFIAIGAVVVVLTVVSYIVYKKLLSKAAKRTPYLYDTIQLMSFEV